MLILELSQPARAAAAQFPAGIDVRADLPARFRSTLPIGLPEVSEPKAPRHCADMSRKFAGANAPTIKDAPITAPLRRPDDVKAVKELDVAWRDPGTAQAAA